MGKKGDLCKPDEQHDRLLNLLAAAYNTSPTRKRGSDIDEPVEILTEESSLTLRAGEGWSNDVLPGLLRDAGYAGKSLDTWLRDGFFEQHCQLFHQRPFIWHVWDGLRDGFAALVNYHKLDRKSLEMLIHTYLGDWINRQTADADNHIDGAEEKLAAIAL